MQFPVAIRPAAAPGIFQPRVISAMRRGESVPAEHAVLLNELRTDVEVGQASVWLDMHLTAIEDLFDAHGSPP